MALLFDLDGTLIDSESAHKSAEAETFRSLGFNFSEADLFRFTGVPYAAMLKQIAPALGLQTFLDAHRERLLGLVGTKIVPFYDVDECLAKLGSTSSMIVTSSPRWYVEAVLKAFPAFVNAFPTYVCADDVSSGKPDPEPYLVAMSRLGVDASTCVAVEDSPNGIASAKSAGCYTVGIRRDDRLDLAKADTVIVSLAQLSKVA